jgi:hypothetical protein
MFSKFLGIGVEFKKLRRKAVGAWWFELETTKNQELEKEKALN